MGFNVRKLVEKAKGAVDLERLRAPSKQREFRDMLYQDALAKDQALLAIAARVVEVVPNPIENQEIIEYGRVLSAAADKFAFTRNCSRDEFLSDNEQTVCRIGRFWQIFRDIDKRAQAFAEEFRLTPAGCSYQTTAAGQEKKELLGGLRLLALYSLCAGDERDQLLGLLSYDDGRCVAAFSKVLALLENAMRRDDAIFYLCKKGVPMELAHRALGRHVMTLIGGASDESAGKFVTVLRAARVPDEVIGRSWIEAGFKKSAVEMCLAR